MSFSLYVLDKRHGLAFELGSFNTLKNLEEESFLDEAILARSLDQAVAQHAHAFAAAAGFDITLYGGCEPPDGYRYEGGAWDLNDAKVRFSRRAG